LPLEKLYEATSEIFIILGLSDCSASILERTGGPDFLSSPTDGNCAVCQATPALYMGDTVASLKQYIAQQQFDSGWDH
jgi:hypothetical protein